MTTIYTIGETIFDIIFEDGQPKAARAGGAMLNSAVSLGRCGLHVEMITEMGRDRVGEIVFEFLQENGVSTSFIRPSNGYNTPVSLAFLDAQGDADYFFYKNYPEERLNIHWPLIQSGDLVLFGSFYSLDPAIHFKVTDFIRSAKKAGAMILYDPNVRKNHLKEIRELMPFLEENISLADIIRGSEEDFINLYGIKGPIDVFNRIRDAGGHNLVITRGPEGATLFTPQLQLDVPARKLEVVSTIGAGDSFNAGLIFGLVKNRIQSDLLQDLGQAKWEEILFYGIDFASEVCQRFDNYISKEKGAKLLLHA